MTNSGPSRSTYRPVRISSATSFGSIATETFGPVIVSCVVANIVMRAFGSYRTPYVMPSFPAIDGIELVCVLALGAICGLGAPLYLKLLSFTKRRFSCTGLPLPFRLAAGGLVVGAISMWWPQVWGNGYEVVTRYCTSRGHGKRCFVCWS
jgi:chloride channel protein, CIC family